MMKNKFSIILTLLISILFFSCENNVKQRRAYNVMNTSLFAVDGFIDSLNDDFEAGIDVAGIFADNWKYVDLYEYEFNKLSWKESFLGNTMYKDTLRKLKTYSNKNIDELINMYECVSQLKSLLKNHSNYYLSDFCSEALDINSDFKSYYNKLKKSVSYIPTFNERNNCSNIKCLGLTKNMKKDEVKKFLIKNHFLLEEADNGFTLKQINYLDHTWYEGNIKFNSDNTIKKIELTGFEYEFDSNFALVLNSELTDNVVIVKAEPFSIANGVILTYKNTLNEMLEISYMCQFGLINVTVNF